MKLNSTFLISALAGIDLASADGRAGIASLLSEIERRDPGAILRSAARVQGRQLREGGGAPVKVRETTDVAMPERKRAAFQPPSSHTQVKPSGSESRQRPSRRRAASRWFWRSGQSCWGIP